MKTHFHVPLLCFGLPCEHIRVITHTKRGVMIFCSLFRLGSLVGIIDIAPTLLDIAQVELPEQMDGKSLKPILDDRYLNRL